MVDGKRKREKNKAAGRNFLHSKQVERAGKRGRVKAKAGPNFTEDKDSKYLQEKRNTIESFLKSVNNNDNSSSCKVQALKEFSISRGGLIDNNIRRQAWPIILGLDSDLVARMSSGMNVDFSKVPVKDQKVIQNDVNRSLTSFSVTQSYNQEQRMEMREKLSMILLRILSRNHGSMHYYQGFHDVCSVHLLTCGSELGEMTAEIHSQVLLLKYLEEDMTSTTSLLNILPMIFQNCDQKVYKFLKKYKVQPFYCVSWVITGLAHDLEDFELIGRIYDVFLSSHEFFPLYFAAALVMHGPARSQLFKNKDMAETHHYLQNLPKNLVLSKTKLKQKKNAAQQQYYIEDIVESARSLMESISPDTLSSYLK
mmetsp:Transcript_970/g.1263  ORF Transcript_970/g.1263 Transcript_970/m.1263 type:complete len:367 (+) Transcript_970:220-1320(+)